jgi:hypothetical protein
MAVVSLRRFEAFDSEGMIRNSGNRFSSGQTRSVCPEMMLKQKEEIMIRFDLI